MELSRREFIKMSGLTLAAMSGNSELFASSGELKVITHATHFGPMRAYVRNGVIEKIEPAAQDYEPVDLLFAWKDRVYAKNRIQYPCVRKSYLDGSNRRFLRGADEFIRVSWDEALELTASALQRAKDTQGNESIFRTTYSPWAHAGLVNKPGPLQGRFLGLFGGFCDIVGDYSAGAVTQTMPHVLGDIEVYSLQTSREVIAEHTELMLMFGTDSFKTNKIGSNVPDHTSSYWYRKIRDNNTKMITVDPMKNTSTKELRSEWVPIKPATDTAMIIAMCYVLYSEKLYDKKFLERYTVGFRVFLKYLKGDDDGEAKTPEWAEDICGVPADKIRELARMCVRKRTLITASWACQRNQHGEQFHWALVTLASMIGQIGLPGGGFSFNMHFSGGGTPYSGVGRPSILSQGRNPVNTFIPASRIGDMLLHPGRTIDYNGRKITYPNVEVIYTAGVTPIGHQPNINKLIKGFRKVDTVITHEPWWTPTAKFSDIILPVTTAFERNDIAFGSSYGADKIWAMKQLISPLFEAKDDYWIFQQLSKMFGFEKQFTSERTVDDWIRWSYEKSKSAVPFEEFWEKGHVQFEISENNRRYVRYADFRDNPIKNHLRTPSGRIEIFSEKVASFGYHDCPGYPRWIKPSESPKSYHSKRYPYQLMSPHPLHRLHSQMDNTSLRESYKISGREPVLVNSKDAEKLGFSTGDVVKVYNSRGAVLAGVSVTDDIKEGTVAIDEGAWYSPMHGEEENTLCVSGQVNVLTSCRPTSKLAQATSANTCMVNLRKVEDPPRNTAYDVPKII